MTGGLSRDDAPGLRVAFWALTFIGTASFCVFSRSWQDWWHTVYDLAAAPVSFAFIAAVLLEAITEGTSPAWWARAWMVLPMTVVASGAQFLGWPISGHLTDLPMAAAGHTLSGRVSRPWLVVCWLMLLPVLYIRWQVFDLQFGSHMRTQDALIVGGACAAIAALATLLARRCSRDQAQGHQGPDVEAGGKRPKGGQRA